MTIAPDWRRLRAWVDSLKPAVRLEYLEKTGLSAPYNWGVWRARPEQLLPEGYGWILWLIVAGRGWGKSRTGAETIRLWVNAHKTEKYCLIAPTFAMARDVIVPTMRRVFPRGQKADWEPSKSLFTFHDGSIAYVRSAEEPDRLRGLEFGGLWADEVSSWTHGVDAWTTVMFGLRIKPYPQAIVTTTPKPNALTIGLMKGAFFPLEQTIITRGSSFDNRANLPQGYVDKILTLYQGTRLGRQEVGGELLEDVAGALWSYVLLDRDRIADIAKVPSLSRIVVSVDPATTVGESSNETGIVVVGRDAQGHAYVLADNSGKYTPRQWAERAIRLKADYHCDSIVVEDNQGGLMNEQVLKNIDPLVHIVRVHASANKAERAAPVFTLYELGKAHHIGTHKQLEDQMVAFVPGQGDCADDRVDALVWAVHELLLKEKPRTDYSMFTAQNTLRLEEFYRRMGYDLTPPGLRRWPW